ncbi:PQQ-binding-like beta-propeller repeat protein, partial [Halorubrum sp. CBA1125]|uniref:outer membrane protein assembly factor BamB family protein n=1 Tax=Halorubrum sp. CBA1125 TaxID=2668072 RepID=UPI0012E8A50C
GRGRRRRRRGRGRRRRRDGSRRDGRRERRAPPGGRRGRRRLRRRRPDRGAGVAVATENETGTRTVRFLDAAGEQRWTATPETTPLNWRGATTRRGPVLALGTADGRLIALEAADGSVRYDVGLQDVPVAVGAVDAGRVYVGGTGDLWSVNLLDGEILWKQQYGAGVRINAPGVADVTGDGNPNPVAVNRGGGVLGTDSGGTPVLRGGLENAVVYGGPLLVDVTSDGTAEVLLVREDGTVVALDT